MYIKVIIKTLKYLLLSIIAFAVFVLFVDIYYPVNLKKAKDLSHEVLDKDGQWLYVTTNSTDKWRFRVNLKKIDPIYLKMLINFEDKRFFNHHGVDLLALFRASWQLLTTGHIKSGGSTITMQVARLLEPKKRTISAKVVEIIMALQLEAHYSKEEILETYLTLAPYGGNIEGIEAASWRFFGKHPYALSVSESAMLVALPKNPEGYRPSRHPKRAKVARSRVIKRAYDRGVINKLLYNRALNATINTHYYTFPRLAPHFSQKILKKSRATKIYTTIDKTLQKQLEIWAKLRGEELPNGASMALLAVENSTGKIRAYIGSNDMFSKKFPGFIDGVDIIRSPGSALKPFIYAMGFDRHIIHPQTVILDSEVSFGNYHPHNYSRRFHGEVTIIEALQNSLNIPAVKVLYRVGAGEFIDKLKLAIGKVYIPKGVATLPVALGGLGITLKQLTQAYVSLANGGKKRAIWAIKPKKSQNDIKLFTRQSSKIITAILRTIPAPKNFTNIGKKIAYKTGTSYGYRDFWSMGYTKEYSVGVWVGRADNQPVVKASAKEIATPIMFETFSILNAIHGLKNWNWSPNFIKETPPKVLKYFDKELKSQNQLKFLYPKDGSKYQSAGCHKVTVRVAIDRGIAPYFWYIDNAPLDFNKTTFQKQFNEGAHRITVIDSSGSSKSVNIWVNMPDCGD